MDASAAPSPRKPHALELFAGLPRHYDAMGAVLSFGQDPRWRRALVAARRRRARSDACSTSRPAPAWSPPRSCAATAAAWSGLDQSAEMLARARERLAADPELARARRARPRARPSGCRSPTASSTRSRSPTCCATSTTPPRRCASWPAWSSPAGAIAVARVRRARRPWPAHAWRLYTRVGLPLLGRLVSRDWYEVGRFLGPSIDGFYARHPLDELTQLLARGGHRVGARAAHEPRAAAS